MPVVVTNGTGNPMMTIKVVPASGNNLSVINVTKVHAWPSSSGLTQTVSKAMPHRLSLGPPDQLVIRFQWHYTRKGIEKAAKKMVTMHMFGQDLDYLVINVVKFISDYSRPGEPVNSRLVITKLPELHDALKRDDDDCDVMYDIPCPIRVMNAVKKRFSYTNG